MSKKNKKLKVFDDYTDAHIFAYWNITKQGLKYSVRKVSTPRRGWAIFYGNGLSIFE